MSGWLNGRRVVVTRAPEDSASIIAALEARGATPVLFPTLARSYPADTGDIEKAWAEVHRFERVVVGSSAALAVFGELEPRARKVPVTCVGDRTAAAIVEDPKLSLRFEVVDVAEKRRAEGMLELLEQRLGPLTGRRFLLPRAPEGRDHLAGALRSRGAEALELLTYRIHCRTGGDLAVLDGADAFSFLSGRTLACFLEAVGASAAARLHAARVAVIGPVAAARAAHLGVRVDVMPETASAEALVEALDATP